MEFFPKSQLFFICSELLNQFMWIISCEAIPASKKLNFKTSSKPDSVSNLLENYGFTKPYISNLIKKNPLILLYNPEKTLQPKFDYFNSKGLSGHDLAKFLSANTRVLSGSLQGKIIPAYDKLKSIVHCDKNVITIIKRNSQILTCKMDTNKMIVNIDLLRDEGVPQSNISRFSIYQPRMFTKSTGRFKEIVVEIKGMGFDPYKVIFVKAIQVVAGLSKSNRESRVDVYRRLGWSDEEIHNAFMLHPQCMRPSEKKITSIIDYLVNQMGYSSLEKRIMPRCSVYKMLTSKGLVKDKITLITFPCLSDESFLKKFVIKFEVEAPELLKLYPSAIRSRAT
ncbi:hypothetical protein C5167_002861 [Papaver somniferum]|uniref:Uncharacterized protein n=1 Tax=Papaver somniferum TaxID=3469 RepID=A0A4Y7KUW4_PAPSO|nr:hypothetical protein C5167_002861 [Papaver somniferum]